MAARLVVVYQRLQEIDAYGARLGWGGVGRHGWRVGC